MLIYEKDNKLNINFDNSIEAQPDVQLSKEDGKVNIEAGGEPVGGLPEATSEDVGKVPTVQEDGSYALDDLGGWMFVVTENDFTLNKTWQEIRNASQNKIVMMLSGNVDSEITQMYYLIQSSNAAKTGIVVIFSDGQNTLEYLAASVNDYPVRQNV